MSQRYKFRAPTTLEVIRSITGTFATIGLGFIWAIVLFVIAVPLYALARVTPRIRSVDSIFVLVDWLAQKFFRIDWEYVDSRRLPDTPCVVLCKHQSSWETFVINRLAHFSTVSKKQLGYIPFFGWGLIWCDAIMIDRRNPLKARADMKSEGKRVLDKGLKILLFPEGTRSEPGVPGNYKSGGAMIANHANVPIVPIAIDSGYYWPRRNWMKYPGTIRVAVGEPIETSGNHRADTNKARDWIEAQLDSWDLPPHMTEISKPTD